LTNELIRAQWLTYFLPEKISVTEPHHFYAAPALASDKNFDAAPAAPAPATTLLYSKAKF
jgi:hypothetical protein